MNDAPFDRSDDRQKRISDTLDHRQPGLVMVLENVADPHNIGAILRSCDAVGVMQVMMVYTLEEPPKVKETSSASGVVKWLNFQKFNSIKACFDTLRAQGFQILATRIDPTARLLYDFDLTVPTAIVLGNEHRGISDEAAQEADRLVYIPMMGMAQSVNVSVASAICLFEALRQRMQKGMYATPQLQPELLRSLQVEWSKK